MEFTSIKDFMDFHAENYKKMLNTTDYNNQIQMCCISRPWGVQIHTEIDIIADMLGLNISEIELDSLKYPYEYELTYKDVRFYQLEENRLVGYDVSN